MPIMDSPAEAEKFTRSRVCARCYGHLLYRIIPEGLQVYCPTCADAWGGATISLRTAERRGQRALSEHYEVRDNLPDLFPNPHAGKSTKQLLAELGLEGE